MKMENITAQKQWYDNIMWVLIVAALLIYAGDLINLWLWPSISEEEAYLYTAMSYLEFVTMWASVILVVLVFKHNRYIKDHIVMNKSGNTFSLLGVGLLVGFLLNGLCALVAYLHGDIQITLMKFEFLPVVGLFIAVFIQSSAEEVLCRGFLYQRLLKAHAQPVVAIFLNALFFAVIHLANDGISVLAFYDLLVTGIFFSLLVYYFGSLWMAMGAHATWNFTQSILLGLPNSGSSFPYSVYQLDTQNVHSSFAYNIEFGLEGTVLSAVLMTACCVVLYLWKGRK